MTKAVSQDRRRSNFRAGGIVLGLLAAASAGCEQRAPSGQVLAVVNGEEITIPELNSEARARGLVVGDDAAVRAALLQELIDRKLLAQAARKQGIDHTPDYILSSRRAAETALVQQLVTDAGRSAQQQPTPQQLNAFIAANPQAFGQRAVVTVEQMPIPGAIPAAKAAPVSAARSLEEAAVLLGNGRLAASKAMQTWDTARLDADSGGRLLNLPPGQLTALHPAGSGWVLVRKVSQTPSPVPVEQQTAFAAALAKAQTSQEFAARLLNQARARAKIVGGSGPDREVR